MVGVALGVDASARGGEPLIDPPPAIVAGGVDHVKEYLRAARATRGVGPRRGMRVDAARERRVGFGGGEPGRGGASPGAVSSRFFLRFAAVATLDLRGARLDALPAALPNCASLRALLVDGNALTDVPDCSSCVDLRRVSLAACRLTRLPSWLARCASLETLVASRNALASPFPDLRACVRLRTLDISENNARELRAYPREFEPWTRRATKSTTRRARATRRISATRSPRRQQNHRPPRGHRRPPRVDATGPS